MRYADRVHAGRELAARLEHLRGDVVILALPRGGVPVGAQVADHLDAPLEVVGVRKLGAPGRPELGVGAIAEHDVRVLDREGLRLLGLQEQDLIEVEARERAELARRLRRYRAGHPLPVLGGRTAVVVDDGLATGVTARAACRAVRAAGADRVVLAVPVGAAASVRTLGTEADEVVCPVVPTRFGAVGAWYERFDQTADEEVLRLLGRPL